WPLPVAAFFGTRATSVAPGGGFPADLVQRPIGKRLSPLRGALLAKQRVRPQRKRASPCGQRRENSRRPCHRKHLLALASEEPGGIERNPRRPHARFDPLRLHAAG